MVYMIISVVIDMTVLLVSESGVHRLWDRLRRRSPGVVEEHLLRIEQILAAEAEQ